MAKNVNGKGRRIKGRFLMLPYAVLQSDSYRSLSPSAVKLLVDIGSQYRGANNGDLSAAMSIMRKLGWKSSATLSKAKRELLDAGMIEETRTGGMNMGCSLYALTWQPIDECLDSLGRARHDARPTKAPSGFWNQDHAQSKKIS